MLQLAVAQLRPRKGAYQENVCRLGRMFREAAGWPVPPGLIVAPESALTGYFLEGGVRELALPAERLFEEGALLAKARRYREAIAKFEQATKANPDEAEFAMWKAFCEFLLADDKRAKLASSAAAIEAGNYSSPKELEFVSEGKSLLKIELKSQKGLQTFDLPAPATFTALLTAFTKTSSRSARPVSDGGSPARVRSHVSVRVP